MAYTPLIFSFLNSRYCDLSLWQVWAIGLFASLALLIFLGVLYFVACVISEYLNRW